MSEQEPSRIAYSIVPSPGHTLQGHPENYDRFQYFDRLTQYADVLSLIEIDAEEAPLETILAVHSPAYQQALMNAVSQAPGFLDYGDTYATPFSYQCALEAAGGTLAVLDAILAGRAQSGFALVRPPGHHATSTRAMGFCLLNNIAIAAREAQKAGLQRVMIFDFDLHHGNGTQEVFASDEDVLYISSHLSGIFPGTGFLREAGSGAGEGTIVNIPLPPRAGDRAMESIVDRVLWPLAQRFSPNMLLVSAGFDAHWRDPLSGLQFTVGGYHKLGMRLVDIARKFCGGKLLFVLEGGYDPQVLAHSVLGILHSMAKRPPPDDPIGQPGFPEPDIDQVLGNVAHIHDIS